MHDTSLQYGTATEGCVSNDYLMYLQDDNQTYLSQILFDTGAQPILECRWIVM